MKWEVRLYRALKGYSSMFTDHGAIFNILAYSRAYWTDSDQRTKAPFHVGRLSPRFLYYDVAQNCFIQTLNKMLTHQTTQTTEILPSSASCAFLTYNSKLFNINQGRCANKLLFNFDKSYDTMKLPSINQFKKNSKSYCTDNCY